MFGESKSEYVSRKVDAWRKDYQRTHEREGIPVDPIDFRSRSLDVKYEAEDSYDFWDGLWPW
jgi:hypothetical protein